MICSLSGGGRRGRNVTGVVVNCSTEAHTVGGSVKGLTGSGLELSLNGGTALSISGNSTFAFPTLIAKGGTYTVTVAQSPSSPSETCKLSNDTGTIASADVTNVKVICYVNSFTIGGQVTGLAGTGLQLQNNNDTAHILPIPSDGAFAFTGGAQRTRVCRDRGGSAHLAVTVLSVDNATVLVSNAAISNVAVTCVTSRFKVGEHDLWPCGYRGTF